MAGRRRGARAGRGWDAAPSRGEPTTRRSSARALPRQGAAATRATEGQPARPADPGEQAREICLRLLAVRPRTRAELASALRSRGVEDEVAAEVLERYGEVGIIDDEAFARAWVTSRHHGKGLAKRALAGELRRKGVDADAVGAGLAELDEATEEETARELVARKLRTERNTAPDAAFRRIVGMLARKGYPAGLAIRVVKEALAERAETAEFAGMLDVDGLAAEAENAAAESSPEDVSMELENPTTRDM